MQFNSNAYFTKLRKDVRDYLIEHKLYNVKAKKWAIPNSPKEDEAGEILSSVPGTFYDDVQTISVILERNQKKTQYRDVLKVMNMEVKERIKTLTWNEIKNMPISSVIPNKHARILMSNGIGCLNDLAAMENPEKAWHCGKGLYLVMEVSYMPEVWERIKYNLSILTGIVTPVKVEQLSVLTGVSGSLYHKILFDGLRAIVHKSNDGISVKDLVYLENTKGQRIPVTITNIVSSDMIIDFGIKSGYSLYQFTVVGWNEP